MVKDFDATDAQWIIEYRSARHVLRRFAVRVAAIGFLALSRVAGAQEILEADAFIGEPFGVARVEMTLAPRAELLGAVVTDRDGRVFYPTHSASTRRVRRLLRELVGAPQRVEAHFLFVGQDPLEIALPGGGGTVRIRPVSNREGHGRLLNDWWSRYASAEKREEQPQSYPSVVDDYLMGSLARRLRLPVPKEFLTDEETGDLTHAVRVLGGAESIRSQWVRRVALGRVPTDAASISLPEALPFTAPAPPVNAQTKIEPIALRVPPELLYVRFGSFPNYLWFSHRMDE